MMLALRPCPLPLLSADLPGTGGSLKVTPEDFVVEELPAYLPSGEGQHLYLWIEKRDRTTQDVVKLLAEASGAGERNIGYAGQKDRHALTRQWFSVNQERGERGGRVLAAGASLGDPRVRILSAARHANKLRLGHAKGNRFTITVRGTVQNDVTNAGPEVVAGAGHLALARAEAILARLGATGLPNFFGPQRFGRLGDNALLGAALLGLGDEADRARAARAMRDRHLRRLALSALQSELFNRVLAERIADGLWDVVVDGDVLQRRGGGLFTTTDLALDTERLRVGEVDLTGPLPGPRERPEARGVARAREDRVLAAAGVPRAAFANAHGEADGARRACRIPLDEVGLRAVAPDALELTFTLPPGAYATRVLAEVTKSDVEVPDV